MGDSNVVPLGGDASGGESPLQEITFEQLFKEGRLPSGYPFELMPDTVETALKVAEVDDLYVWRKKALEAHVVLRSVAEHTFHEDDSPGVEFIHGMLDTDVIFLALAWSSQMNGFKIRLSEGVPCPSCASAFMEIPFGNLRIFARTAPIEGPEGIFPVEGMDQNLLPKSIRGGSLFVCDPVWKVVRRYVAEKSWESAEVVAMYRAMGSLRHSSKSAKSPRAVAIAEAKQMSARTLRMIIDTLDRFVPHFEGSVDLKCEQCKSVSIVPFEQGL